VLPVTPECANNKTHLRNNNRIFKKPTTRFMAIIQVNCIKNWRLLLVQFYGLHVLGDGNQCIWVREKMLEFSSTVLCMLYPYVEQIILTDK